MCVRNTLFLSILILTVGFANASECVNLSGTYKVSSRCEFNGINGLFIPLYRVSEKIKFEQFGCEQLDFEYVTDIYSNRPIETGSIDLLSSEYTTKLKDKSMSISDIDGWSGCAMGTCAASVDWKYLKVVQDDQGNLQISSKFRSLLGGWSSIKNCQLIKIQD